jgi:hypothetical protein
MTAMPRTDALVFQDSLADLGRIGDRLKPGLVVTLYSPSELEVEAVLERGSYFDTPCWLGVPVGPFKLMG